MGAKYFNLKALQDGKFSVDIVGYFCLKYFKNTKKNHVTL